VSQAVTSKNIPYIVTHDGRTIRYPDPLVKVNDTVKIDLASGKVTEFLKFEVGSTVMITRGRNTGRVGVFTSRETHEGSFDIAHVKDSAGTSFATRLGNAFIIGKGADAEKALISLPRGKGIKQTIFDDRVSARARAVVARGDTAALRPSHALPPPRPLSTLLDPQAKRQGTKA
jgi:small subunit ribosomal protein S4e